MNAIHLSVPPSSAFDAARSARAKRGAIGGNKRWAGREPWSAYVIPANKSTRWNILWYRRGGRKHQGSVDSEAEARAICDTVIAALRAGIEPPKLPTGRSTKKAETTFRSDAEVEARRAVIRALMDNPERCGACGLCRPCAPCPGDPETKHEMRSARKGTE